MPVIGARARGLLERVDASCGILVEPGDTDALVAAILALHRDAGRAFALGAVGRARAARFLPEPLALYDARGGADYSVERVSQSEHALQTARLASLAGAPEPLIVAALLHDIGHLLGDQDEVALARDGRDGRHETRGTALLKRFFRPEMARPVALHVAAKRYLCAVDAGYTEGLSPASTRSLELQGGPLDARQARAFEHRPGWQDAVLLRRWDDAAKVPGLRVPGFGEYRTLLEGCLASEEAGSVPPILRALGGPIRIP
jgi:gamma-butyrobetaine dioxygenase